MTDFQDYLNTHKLYPDNISRRIDIAPGFDSDRTPKESLSVDKQSLTTLRDVDGEIVGFWTKEADK